MAGGLTRVGNTCDTLADTVDLKTFSYYSKYTNCNSPTIVLMSKGKEGCRFLNSSQFTL